jgi:hypothetical protein
MKETVTETVKKREEGRNRAKKQRVIVTLQKPRKAVFAV